MTDIDPHIWGPSFWSTYHLYASSYPIHPTPIIMDAARSFVKQSHLHYHVHHVPIMHLLT